MRVWKFSYLWTANGHIEGKKKKAQRHGRENGMLRREYLHVQRLGMIITNNHSYGCTKEIIPFPKSKMKYVRILQEE